MSAILRERAEHCAATLADVRAAQADNDAARSGRMRKARKIPWAEFFRATEALIAEARRA